MSTSGDVVPWVRAASWESRVGVAVVETRNMMVAVVQLPWTSCHVYGHMYIKTRVLIFQAREQVLFYYFGSIGLHMYGRVPTSICTTFTTVTPFP